MRKGVKPPSRRAPFESRECPKRKTFLRDLPNLRPASNKNHRWDQSSHAGCNRERLRQSLALTAPGLFESSEDKAARAGHCRKASFRNAARAIWSRSSSDENHRRVDRKFQIGRAHV